MSDKGGPRRTAKSKGGEPSQRQSRGKAGSEGPKGDKRNNERNNDRKDERNNERKDERKNTFVPWLGEAKPKRGSIYDLEAKLGETFMVEFHSGRVVEGKLQSFDRYMNLVLEETVEKLDNAQTRQLGKVFVCGRVESMGPV